MQVALFLCPYERATHRALRSSSSPCNTETCAQVDVGGAFEAIEVPLVAPGSRVLTPDVQLPLGLTFEGTECHHVIVKALKDNCAEGVCLVADVFC